MKKQELTDQEMTSRVYKYAFRSFLFLVISIPFFAAGIGIMAATDWKITGFVLLIIAIGCIISSIVLGIASSYYNRKSLEKPDWVKRVDERWERTYGQRK